MFAVVTDAGEQERAVVDAPLRGQHQESVGLDAPAAGYDPGDRLRLGGPVFGAWRPGAGPELLDHRLALYDVEQRMVFGANTYRQFDSCSARAQMGPTWVTPGSPG